MMSSLNVVFKLYRIFFLCLNHQHHVGDVSNKFIFTAIIFLSIILFSYHTIMLLSIPPGRLDYRAGKISVVRQVHYAPQEAGMCRRSMGGGLFPSRKL